MMQLQILRRAMHGHVQFGGAQKAGDKKEARRTFIMMEAGQGGHC
jgi:hypothetical protein